jgi:hypothetical protein
MSIERVFYCDWRDCGNNVRTARSRPDSGLIYVTDHPGPTLHFCSWDCVLKHAAEKPPVEFFPASAA